MTTNSSYASHSFSAVDLDLGLREATLDDLFVFALPGRQPSEPR
ncbi:MAG: hypothetical protein QGF67_06965 [Lentisphaeria bacterium]|nr:hypothetical protein [Lentisphaeria bacterium]MDP7741162.1 hypothetical protein [Lentisphaeria bacterium]